MTVQTLTPSRTLTLRDACTDDARVIAALKTCAAARAYGRFTTDAELDAWLDRRADAAVLAPRIADTRASGGRYLLAELNGFPVGAGMIRPEDGGAYLADVYCDPPGTGAGTRLVTQLLGFSAAQGWGTVRCFVLDQNAAGLRFFTSLGFEAVDTTPNRELPGSLIEMHRPA